MKKEGGSFYVTIGAYDGAQVCELIGIYMLYLIRKKYDSKNIGLYRDDGLAVFKNVSEPASEKIKKQLQSLFKQKTHANTYQRKEENNENNKNIGKNRKRNIIWFNPP